MPLRLLLSGDFLIHPYLCLSTCVSVCVCASKDAEHAGSAAFGYSSANSSNKKIFANNVSKAAAAAKSADRGVLYNYSTMLLRELLSL